MSERWLPVVGWEGLYEVSDHGRVRRAGGRLLSQAYASNGRSNRYYKVSLHGNGLRKSCYVHRLVLAAFEGPCPRGHEGAHKNGDTRNNELQNLAWKTPKANSADRVTHGTQYRGGYWHRSSPEILREIRRAVAAGATQQSQCKRFGLSNGFVCQVVNRTGRYRKGVNA